MSALVVASQHEEGGRVADLQRPQVQYTLSHQGRKGREVGERGGRGVGERGREEERGGREEDRGGRDREGVRDTRMGVSGGCFSSVFQN